MDVILKTLGAKTPFDNNGELTREGAEAYDKLILILGELNHIGAMSKDVDDFEKYFDEIIRLGF